MVYSTCSFSETQNEGILRWLLEEVIFISCPLSSFQEGTAELIPVDVLKTSPAVEGSLKHTLRFYPKATKTSGMFIAKVKKRRE